VTSSHFTKTTAGIPPFYGNRNFKTPTVMTRTLHLPKPYDSQPTPHTAMQPRMIIFNPPPHRAVRL
jgi:hypothetical protein